MKQAGRFTYIAISPSLLDWAVKEHDLYPMKVGTAYSIAWRQNGLNHGHRGSGSPCCGLRDWRIVANLHFASRREANDLESRLHESFEAFEPYLRGRHAVPWPLPTKGNGETEIFAMPRDPVSPSRLATLDADVRDLYWQGRRAMEKVITDLVSSASEVPPNDEEREEREREIQAFRADATHEYRETHDRWQALFDGGHYYED